MDNDYYNILGVSKNASDTEIKSAFRKKARELHPDRNKAPDAGEQFKKANEAYQVLSDPQKRKMYDQFGTAGPGFGSGNGSYGGGQGFGNGFDFDQFQSGFSYQDLGDLFGNFFGGGQGFGGRRDIDENDIRLSLKLEFMEAVLGTTIPIDFDKYIKCKHCEGKGGEGEITCPTCKGSGQVQKVAKSMFGNIAVTTTCTTCSGAGKTFKKECNVCFGTGRVRERRSLQIVIPKGSPDGLELRFKGEGNVGERGGQAGDLYIILQVNKHEFFQRRNDDIYIQIPISITSAVLGDDIEIPTVTGKVRMKIPAGTQSGKEFVLDGKGAPRFKGNGFGNQIVKVEVRIPQKLSREEKDLWQQLKQVDDGTSTSGWKKWFKA